MTTETQTLREAVDKALGRAYSLGQTYWQQADSDFISHNRKSDETQARFDAMRAETVAAVSAVLDAYPADWRQDSSLETWFPFTAEQVKAQEAEIARLREALERIIGKDIPINIVDVMSDMERNMVEIARAALATTGGDDGR